MQWTVFPFDKNNTKRVSLEICAIAIKLHEVTKTNIERDFNFFFSLTQNTFKLTIRTICLLAVNSFKYKLKTMQIKILHLLEEGNVCTGKKTEKSNVPCDLNIAFLLSDHKKKLLYIRAQENHLQNKLQCVTCIL